MREEIPVFVVIPPRLLLLDIAGPIEILRQANRLQSAVRFDVRHIGPSREVHTSIGATIARIAPLPVALPDRAWLVLAGDVEEPLPGCTQAAPAPCTDRADEAALVNWLRSAVTSSHTLICICTGALYAARAGLLDEHVCTTHHASIAELARLAPHARVLENRLFVEDRNRFTSAGITAGIDLMLHLLHRHAGPACTLGVARYLVIYLRRNGADPQLSPFLEGRNHLHPAVHRVQDAIAADLTRAWTQAGLARLAGASPRHLARLFAEHTGMTLLEYARRLRLAHARQLLRETRLDMERIAEQSGFGSARQLHRAWRKRSPTPPSAERR